MALVVRRLEELVRLGRDQPFLVCDGRTPNDQRLGSLSYSREELIPDAKAGQVVVLLLHRPGQRQADAPDVLLGRHTCQD
jgi:hypothetical protein